MELSVYERLLLLGALPKEGNFLTLKTVRELREQLAFDEDGKEINLRQEGDQLKWDKSVDKEFEFSGGGKAVIADALKALDADKKLTEPHFRLYEEFVGE